MPEITKSKAFNPGNLFRIGLGAVIAAFYFFGLNIPLLGPDEPRYAQVAREMFERGDWITPTLGGFHWFEKPALLYWLEIVSYKVFGVSEFSARFGSAVFGLATVAALWLLGRNAGLKGASRAFSNYLALIAASSIGIIVFARGASFDIILTFPVTAALVSFLIYETSERDTGSGRKKWAALISFYVFIGIALLAKGLVGWILPLGVVAAFYALSFRFPSKAFIWSLAWGILISIVVASAWYLPIYLRHGNEFVDEFIIQQHFQRYLSNKYQHPQPFYFFFWVLPLMTIPWLPFLAAAIWDLLKDAIIYLGEHRRPSSDAQTRLRIFAAAWMIVPVLFFSLSGSKLPGYVLPALPGALVLLTEKIWRTGELRRSWRAGIVITAAAVFFVTSILLVRTVPDFAAGDSVKALIGIADGKGNSTQYVLGFHTVSHNAEFYAAGRLVRSVDGKQRKFISAAELAAEIRRESSGRALVLSPLNWVPALDSNEIDYEILADNGDLAIIEVWLR